MSVRRRQVRRCSLPLSAFLVRFVLLLVCCAHVMVVVLDCMVYSMMAHLHDVAAVSSEATYVCSFFGSLSNIGGQLLPS